MGDRLINIARRMKVNTRNKGESERVKGNDRINGNTMEAYCEMAHMITGKLRNDSASEKGEARRDADANKAEGPKQNSSLKSTSMRWRSRNILYK